MKKALISTVALAGIAAGLNAQTPVSSAITTDTTWSGEYVLEGVIFVKNGATLEIQPGTIVRGQPRTAAVQQGVTAGTPGALVVTQNGRIEANGTSDDPIIFTTAAIDVNGDNVPDDSDSDGFLDPWTGTEAFYDDSPDTAPLAPLNANGEANVSLWGGMVICGNAPTNRDDTDGVGYGKALVEGLTVPGFPATDATYGGVQPHDNSGSLQYVSVRHAGDEIGNGNELNGITLAGVGDGTTFENVEVYCNFDDGMEWFGGTVNGKNLAVFFAGDDAFDLDQGYTGSNQFCFGIMPFFNENSGALYGSKSGDKAGEWDGLDQDSLNLRRSEDSVTFDGTPWPLSNPEFWNMTIIGTTPVASPEFTPVSVAADNNGIQMRRGFAGSVYSAFVVNTGTDQGFDIPNDGRGPTGFETVDNVNNGLVNVVSSTFADVTAPATDESTAIANGDAIAANYSGDANVVNGGNTLVQEDVSFDPTGDANGKLDSSLKASPIDPRPAFAISGVTGGAVAQGSGLEGVAYRGAFENLGSVDLWTDGWTALSIAGLLD